jgi:acyl-coenzyme A thioesterase PaaI-like protein
MHDQSESARAELGRLADRVRALIDATVACDAPPPPLLAACAAVDQAIATLTPFIPEPRPPRYPKRGDLSKPAELMPYDPMMGRLSPLAPPIQLTWEDGKAIGRVRFGTPYEGPPGCVHGGIIAAAFDQVLNVANLMCGIPGPTARLALRFRRPTPLAVDLVFEGWHVRTEGRRVHARGRLRHGEEVTVEAKGVFVRLPLERVMKLLTPG